MGIDFTGFDNEEEFARPFFAFPEEVEVEEPVLDHTPRRTDNLGGTSGIGTNPSIPDERTPMNPNNMNNPPPDPQMFAPESFEGQVKVKCTFVSNVLVSIGEFFKGKNSYTAETGIVC